MREGASVMAVVATAMPANMVGAELLGAATTAGAVCMVAMAAVTTAAARVGFFYGCPRSCKSSFDVSTKIRGCCHLSGLS